MKHYINYFLLICSSPFYLSGMESTKQLSKKIKALHQEHASTYISYITLIAKGSTENLEFQEKKITLKERLEEINYALHSLEERLNRLEGIDRGLSSSNQPRIICCERVVGTKPLRTDQ